VFINTPVRKLFNYAAETFLRDLWPTLPEIRDAMRARIAEILGLDVSRISVKATTTEGMGFTGRREGIAAQAVATIRLP